MGTYIPYKNWCQVPCPQQVTARNQPDSGPNFGLEVLSLSNNRLVSLPGDIMAGGTPALRILALAENQFSSLPSNAFSAATELDSLDISGNSLSSLRSDALSALIGLEKLDLSGNSLSQLPQDIFSRLSDLRALDLSRNALTTLPPQVFVGLTSLERLSLDRNPGSPFHIPLFLQRTDTSDVLAPGPATVEVSAPDGAPFSMELPLSIEGGSLSSDTARLSVGLRSSTTAEVTQDPQAAAGTRVSVARSPLVPDAVAGISLDIIGTLTLFASSVPTITLETSKTDAPEGGRATLRVRVDPPSMSPIRVGYRLGVDNNPESSDADASDYVGDVARTVDVERQATTASIDIVIVDDDDIESPREVFAVTLDAPDSDADYQIGPNRTAIVSIKEGVCDRTSQVQIGLLARLQLTDCTVPTPVDLARVNSLDLCFPKVANTCFRSEDNAPIVSLQSRDFADMPRLRRLDLGGN